jgi:hypothetical protein
MARQTRKPDQCDGRKVDIWIAAHGARKSSVVAERKLRLALVNERQVKAWALEHTQAADRRLEQPTSTRAESTQTT